MKKEPIIVIDGNFIGHTCRFINAVYFKGRECGVIYNLLERVIDLAEAYQTRKFVFAWDSRHSYRKKKFPWYKEKRKEKRKELTEEEKETLQSMYRQIDILTGLLPEIGFENSIMQNGIEGDDIMAMVCRNYPDHKIVLVANDHDLYQLLDGNVSMVTPRMEYLGKEFSKKHFFEKFKITPDLWSEVKALAGCDSDEVPGIARIGEKTACKYLAKELKETSDAYKRITCADGQKIRIRNLELVKLPHAKTKPIVLKNDKLNWEKFQEVCNRYKFRVFLNERRDEWKRLFNIVEG